MDDKKLRHTKATREAHTTGYVKSTLRDTWSPYYGTREAHATGHVKPTLQDTKICHRMQ